MIHANLLQQLKQNIKFTSKHNTMKTLLTAVIASILFLTSCTKDAEVPASTDFYKDENITITSAKAEKVSSDTKITLSISGDVTKIQLMQVMVYPTLQTITFNVKQGENVILAPTPNGTSIAFDIYAKSNPAIKFSSTNYVDIK